MDATVVHPLSQHVAALRHGPAQVRLAAGPGVRAVLTRVGEKWHVGRSVWTRSGTPDADTPSHARRGWALRRGWRTRLSRARGRIALAAPWPLGTRVHAGDAVTGLFVGAVGREPDTDALISFAGRLATGASAAELAHELADSEEVRQQRRAAVADEWRERLRTAWSDPAALAAARPLVFLHTMKTAGSSLKTALAGWWDPRICLLDAFLDELVLLPPQVLATAGFVTGHLPFEALTLFPVRPRTVTVLRDPVERTVSHYLHVRRSPEVAASNPGFSLAEFLAAPQFAAAAGNYQARYLAHEIGLATAWREWSPEARFAALGPPYPSALPLPLQSLFDATPLSVDDDALARLALTHLGEVDHVGIVDDLEALVGELAAALHRPLVAVPRDNVRPRSDRRVDLPAGLLRRIDEATQIDRLLYEEARRRARRRAGRAGRAHPR